MKPSFNKNKNKNDKIKNQNKKQYKQKPQMDNPIKAQIDAQGGQIIRGYFLNDLSYKELIIQRINKVLYCILGFLVLFCLVCYYFVSCNEVKLNKISRETLELNYENEDLQNKVDSLQSYYNIDKAVSKTNILDRAKQVVEINAISLPNIDINKTKNYKTSTIINY